MHARMTQYEILWLLERLDTPEAALLVSPYLFDRSPYFKYSPDQPLGALNSFAAGTLDKMPLQDKPVYSVPFPGGNERVRAWQEWWIRMAPVFGAEAPASVNASRAEVALLNSKAHPNEEKLKELRTAATSVPQHSEVTVLVDEGDANGPIPIRPQWVWFGALCFVALAFILVFRMWKKGPP